VRVLVACSLGGAGHLHPLLPFLGAAQRRGDETLVVGPPALRAMVEETGFSFHAGAEPAEEEVAAIRDRLPTAPVAEASLLGNRELFGRLATTAMLPAMEQVCGAWRPDLVLREPCEYASAVVGSRRGIKTSQVAISLAAGEAGSIAMAAPALEEHRLGLVEELRRSPYLTRFPASLDPSPFPVTIRFRPPTAPAGATLPDWWKGSVAPCVYMSFGTVLGYMSIAGDVYRAVLKAAAGLDVRAVMTVGRQFDPSALGPIPDNVRVEAWVEQDDALAWADVVVCHGGSGTAFGAMAAGVPVVAVPLFADQFDNGRRIADAGAGVVVESRPGPAGRRRSPITTLDAPRIARGIETVLGHASYRSQARRVAAEIASALTVDEVLASLLSGAGIET